MGKPKKFVVVGPHRVHEVKPGEGITLDPSKPESRRLLARGQIVPAPSGQRPADEAPLEDAPVSEESEELS